MAGMVLIEPTDLYNLLNQGTQYPCLSDPNYLLLLGKSTMVGLDERQTVLQLVGMVPLFSLFVCVLDCLLSNSPFSLSDCRAKEDYEESHVITSKKAPKVITTSRFLPQFLILPS